MEKESIEKREFKATPNGAQIGGDYLLQTFYGLPNVDYTRDTYYDIILRKIKPGRYTLEDVLSFINRETAVDEDYNGKDLGVFASAAINKFVKEGEKINWKLTKQKPVDCLFYKLEGVEVHVNIAGDALGIRARNSKFYVKEVGDEAGLVAVKCEFNIGHAGNYLGLNARNSKFYVKEVGDVAGLDAVKCEFNIGHAGNHLGTRARSSKFYVKEVGDEADLGAVGCKFYRYTELKTAIQIR